MSTTDCRTLHVYRVPVYQKRTIAWENYPPTLSSRSSSPNRAKFASERRHSTPQTSFKLNFTDFHSPSASSINKQSKSTNTNKDSNFASDGIKTPSRPVSLVKLRPPDERLNRLVTTPTSINSFTDVILPMAKKNRNTFIETPNTTLTDIQATNRSIPTLKRGKTITDDFEANMIVADGNPLKSSSSKANPAKSKSRKYRGQNSNCSFCHWYCSCPFYCWILCSLLVLFLFIGLFFSKKVFVI